MAGTQAARAPAPETMAQFVARRDREQAARERAFADGSACWSASTSTGENLAAPRTADVMALGINAPRYGALSAPPPDDLADLRRQQADFNNVTREIDRQNEWMAIPALAPVAAVGGLEAGAAILGRSVAAALPPLSFAEREAWQQGSERAAQALSRAAKDALRAQARARYAQANGIPASRMQAQVHHSDPLEYAHLKPAADPNRLANLWGLADEWHAVASRAWADFGRELNGRVPTQAELMAAKLRIDRLVEPYLQRPGAVRPYGRPGSGGTR